MNRKFLMLIVAALIFMGCDSTVTKDMIDTAKAICSQNGGVARIEIIATDRVVCKNKVIGYFVEYKQGEK